MKVEVMGDVVKSEKIKCIDIDAFYTISLLKTDYNNYQVIITCTNIIDGRKFTPCLIKYYDNITSEKKAVEIYDYEISITDVKEK